jgi:thiosulfate reductase cytochrome b subunit
MTKLYLYPFWLRIWHWINAGLFLLLILSGISLHYSATNDLLVPFETAITIHNVSGVLLALMYLMFLIFNIASGNIKHYIPEMKNMISRQIKQAKFYLIGIFKKEPHPYHPSHENKFNPLQQVTYFAIMYFLIPVVIISGLFLMFPGLAPEKIFEMSGIAPMAILHYSSGFFLSVFMFGHIYLATTGNKVTENFKSMVTGWHHLSHEK